MMLSDVFERLCNLLRVERTREGGNTEGQIRHPCHRIATDVVFILPERRFKNIRGTDDGAKDTGECQGHVKVDQDVECELNAFFGGHLREPLTTLVKCEGGKSVPLDKPLNLAHDSCHRIHLREKRLILGHPRHRVSKLPVFWGRVMGAMKVGQDMVSIGGKGAEVMVS